MDGAIGKCTWKSDIATGIEQTALQSAGARPANTQTRTAEAVEP